MKEYEMGASKVNRDYLKVAPRYKYVNRSRSYVENTDHVTIEGPGQLLKQINTLYIEEIVYELLKLIPEKQLSVNGAKKRESVQNRLCNVNIIDDKIDFINLFVFDLDNETKTKFCNFFRTDFKVKINCSHNLMTIYFDEPMDKLYEILYFCEIICWMGKIDE